MIHKLLFSVRTIKEEKNWLVFLLKNDYATLFVLVFIIGNYKQQIQVPFLFVKYCCFTRIFRCLVSKAIISALVKCFVDTAPEKNNSRIFKKGKSDPINTAYISMKKVLAVYQNFLGLY